MASLPRRSRAPLTTVVVAAEGGLLYTIDVSSLPQCECPLRFFFRRTSRRSISIVSADLSPHATASQFDPSLVRLDHVFSATGRCYHAAGGLEGACPPPLTAFEVAASYPQSSVTSLSMSAAHRCCFVGTTSTVYNYYSNMHTIASGLRSARSPPPTSTFFLTSEGQERSALSKGTEALLRRFPLLASPEGPTAEDESGKGCIRVVSWQGEWVGVVGQEQRWTTKYRYSFADPYAPPDSWLPLPELQTQSAPLVDSDPERHSLTPSDAVPMDRTLDAGHRLSSVMFTPNSAAIATPRDDAVYHVDTPHENPQPSRGMRGKCVLTATAHRLRTQSRARHRQLLLKQDAVLNPSSQTTRFANSSFVQKHLELPETVPLLEASVTKKSASSAGNDSDHDGAESEMSLLVAEGPSLPLGVRAAKVRLRKEGASQGTSTLSLHRQHQQALDNVEVDDSSSSSDASPGDLRQRLKVHARLKLRLETSRKDGAVGKARRDWSERPSHNLVLQDVATPKPKKRTM
jgi:hypothetical protein